MNQIGERVQLRRDVLHDTQDALCARIATVAHGARIVTDLELLALAQALDCSPCWLLLGDAMTINTA